MKTPLSFAVILHATLFLLSSRALRFAQDRLREGSLALLEEIPRACGARNDSAEAPSRPRGFDVHGDLPPLALAESGDGEGRARQMPEHDREPDVGRLKTAHR